MFKCPGCGAGMRFDPASQKMKCDYCGTLSELSELKDDGAAEERDDFDVTMYTCPSCGAKLGSVETSAAEFCSFCGASVVLNSRLDRMSKPAYIIPFKRTKEDCRKSLTKYLKAAIFLPKEFRSAAIDSMRGIYMPYWNYQVRQEGRFGLTASKFSHHTGDYDYYDVYSLESDIDAEYMGIPHDASKEFADRVSEALEPYDYKNKLDFNTGYMAGFYADIKDADSKEYEKDVMGLANRMAKDTVLLKTDFAESEVEDFKPENAEKMTDRFNTKVTNTESTMVPVWFMAYRHKDRVAYAAVNGETGKVVSDMPLDMKKIWMLIPLLAIPIYILLNIFMSATARVMLQLSVILAGIAGALFVCELNLLKKRDENGASVRAKNKKRKKREKTKGGFGDTLLELLIYLLISATVVSIVIGVIAAVVLLLSTPQFSLVLPALVALLMIVWIFKAKRSGGIAADRYSIIGYAVILSAMAAAIIVIAINPVNDIVYYAAAFFPFAAVIYTIWRILAMINLFATRPLPQLVRRENE